MIRCLLFGHQWAWADKITELIEWELVFLNVNCDRCGKKTWAHGRGPFRA